MIRQLHECVDAQGSFFADVIVRVKSIVDIEVNEADFEAPLTIGLTLAVFWKTHLLCRLQILLTLFTALQGFA